MNVGEADKARRLLPKAADRFGGVAYVLGDSLYDSNDLFALCREHGTRLLAPRKKPHTGLGHRPHDPAPLGRLRCIRELEGNADGVGGRRGASPLARALYACRTGIERYFGHAGSFGGGLGPLPRFVRRFHRVARWVHAKLLINCARLHRLQQQQQQQQQPAAAA